MTNNIPAYIVINQCNSKMYTGLSWVIFCMMQIKKKKKEVFGKIFVKVLFKDYFIICFMYMYIHITRSKFWYIPSLFLLLRNLCKIPNSLKLNLISFCAIHQTVSSLATRFSTSCPLQYLMNLV